MMSIRTDLWELFFPRCCLICGNRLSHGEKMLCLNCLSGLPRTGFHLQKDNPVECNFWGKFPVERATSYLYYAKGGDVRQLLYELKYHNNKEVGEIMGRTMAAELMPSHFFEGIDLIIPVPLHRRRERQRGYNQSGCLAQGISAVTGIPVHPGIMVRSRYTETQTHKGQYERWENVQDLFVCSFPEQLENKHVLLVDDVLTTGATIVSCADALRAVPGLRISVLTLALAGDS
ncbi:ComF family protein [Phocaeicola sp.]